MGLGETIKLDKREVLEERQEGSCCKEDLIVNFCSDKSFPGLSGA